MTVWRYYAQRWSGKWLHRELPLGEVRITSALSGPGQLTATVDPVWAGLQASDGRPLLDEWSTLIWAEADGQLRGGGILVDSTFTGQKWALDVAGFSSYAAGQPLVNTLTWGGSTAGVTGNGVDPLTVVRALWSHLQSKPSGNLGVTVDNTTSGYRLGEWHNARKIEDDGKLGPAKEIQTPPIPIDRVWDSKTDKKPVAAQGKTVYWMHRLGWWDNVQVGAKVDELAKQTPFEYRERVAWKPGREGVTMRLELGAPRLGKRQTRLRFVEDENIVNIVPVKRSGDDFASEVHAYGAGEGSKQLRQIQSLTGGRLRRAAAVDRPDVTTAALLKTVAADEVRRRNKLVDIHGFTVTDHPHARIGSFGPGDDVLVQTRGGWLPTRLWVRVTGVTTIPGSRAVEVTCRRSDSFDYAGG